MARSAFGLGPAQDALQPLCQVEPDGCCRQDLQKLGEQGSSYAPGVKRSDESCRVNQRPRAVLMMRGRIFIAEEGASSRR